MYICHILTCFINSPKYITMNLKINCNLAEHTRYLCWVARPPITDGQPTQHRHGTSRVVSRTDANGRGVLAFRFRIKDLALSRFFCVFMSFVNFFCILSVFFFHKGHKLTSPLCVFSCVRSEALSELICNYISRKRTASPLCVFSCDPWDALS